MQATIIVRVLCMDNTIRAKNVSLTVGLALKTLKYILIFNSSSTNFAQHVVVRFFSRGTFWIQSELKKTSYEVTKSNPISSTR